MKIIDVYLDGVVIGREMVDVSDCRDHITLEIGQYVCKVKGVL